MYITLKDMSHAYAMIQRTQLGEFGWKYSYYFHRNAPWDRVYAHGAAAPRVVIGEWARDTTQLQQPPSVALAAVTTSCRPHEHTPMRGIAHSEAAVAVPANLADYTPRHRTAHVSGNAVMQIPCTSAYVTAWDFTRTSCATTGTAQGTLTSHQTSRCLLVSNQAHTKYTHEFATWVTDIPRSGV